MSMSVQPLQQIGNLNLLGQRHDPLLIQSRNRTWLQFECGWLLFITVSDVLAKYCSFSPHTLHYLCVARASGHNHTHTYLSAMDAVETNMTTSEDNLSISTGTHHDIAYACATYNMLCVCIARFCV